MQTISADEFKRLYGEQGLASFKQTQSQPGKIAQAFKGGIDYTKQGLSQISHAHNSLDVLEGGLKTGSGLIGAAFSPTAPVIEPTFGAGINKIADKISNIPQVQQFAQSQAGQTTSRVSENLANAGVIAGTIAGGLKTPQVAGMAGDVASGVAKAPLAGAGRVLKATGEGLYKTTISPEESTAQALLKYDAKQPTFTGRIKNLVTGQQEGKPVTEANTAARYGLAGTEYRLGVQAKQAQSSLWENIVKPKLAENKGAVNMKEFLGTIEKDINKIPDLTRRNALKEALQAVKEDYKNVGKINLEKLQDYKKGWAEFLPEATYKGKPIGTALKAVHDLMARKARSVIYKHIGEEGKQAYLDYSNLESIIKSGVKSLTGDPASKSISRNVWQFVMNKAVTPVVTIGGKVLYKTGEGLELLGDSGAKTVGEVINSPKGKGAILKTKSSKVNKLYEPTR